MNSLRGRKWTYSGPSSCCSVGMGALVQGLTLVHFSAQLERILWDRGGIQGVSRGGLRGVLGHYGVSRVHCVSKTAQVELNSGRV